MRALLFLITLTLAFMATGCSTIYYGYMEKMGWEKRDLLINRVEDAQSAQEKAKKQFESALEEFRSLVAIDAGELEGTYDDLNSEYKRCKERANLVTERIAEIERVSEALFREWEGELNAYSSADLRRRSEQQLNETRRSYDQLLRAMSKAEGKMLPVLEAFEDQVLFLKHNLNAAAIASLQGEVVTLETNVDSLIREMELSIAEADQFIAKMDQK